MSDQNFKKRVQDRFISRRQFLYGGGQLLMLPPLISLMPRQVFAAGPTGIKRVITMVGRYGVEPTEFFPKLPANMTQVAGATDAYYALLSSMPKNLSNVLGIFETQYANLLPHMNIIEGLCNSAKGRANGTHNASILAGANQGNETVTTSGHIRTMDVVLEKSPNFYKGSSVPHKAIRIASNPQVNGFSYDRPANQKEKIVSDQLYSDKAVFNTLFGSFNPGTGGGGTTTPKPNPNDVLIVDNVLEDLKAVQKNPRLSKSDKLLVDNYIASVDDLQRSVSEVKEIPVGCTKPNLAVAEGGIGVDYDFDKLMDNYIKLIQLAMICDLSRVFHITNVFWKVATKQGNSHQDFHHDRPLNGADQAKRHKWGIEKFIKLAETLRSTADPLNEGSLLDNSVMLWTNELGSWTDQHSHINLPTMMFGSAGGALRTGLYLDYRQRPLQPFKPGATGQFDKRYHLGRPSKQVLQSIMQAVGVPKTEYSLYGDGSGYGGFIDNIVENSTRKVYSAYAKEHNDPLPYLFKG